MTDPEQQSDDTRRAFDPQMSSDRFARFFLGRSLDAPSHPGIPACLDRFEILRIIGEGGMGIVFLARDPERSGEVAIKMLKPELHDDPRAVRQFLKESDNMKRLDHPHILKVLEISDRPHGHYYVMPYLKWGSLATNIQPGKSLEADLTLQIARDIAAALSFAHTKGIIHRDLKPGNVMLDDDGKAYLSDFGLLRTVYNDSLIDVRRARCEGTLPYLSPAVAAGQAEDTRCDIYSFGATLYEMLTGEPPYSAATPSLVIEHILSGPPEPILKRNPDAPKSLVQISEGAMARNLRDRYASMSDVLADLDRCAEGRRPLGPHGRKKSKLKFLLIPFAAAVILVLAAISTLINTHPPTSSSDPSKSETKPPPSIPRLKPPPSIQTTITMVKIPGGEFQMGRHVGEGSANELPVHLVYVSSFSMSRYEVTNQQYCDFLNAAYPDLIKVIGGIVYAFDDAENRQPYCVIHNSNRNRQIDFNNLSFSVRDKGRQDMSRHPVVLVSWYGAAAFCNWRSEYEGLETCYNVSSGECDFTKKGYRLPTEAEWEYAARGGQYKPYYRYPWGDTLSHSQANYNSDSSLHYDISPTRGFHPDWNDEIYPYTAEVGSFAANGYGLFDMVGNVWEWCNDWYEEYSYRASPYKDPTGPVSGSQRVYRDGCWFVRAYYCRVARRFRRIPEYSGPNGGFRVCISSKDQD